MRKGKFIFCVILVLLLCLGSVLCVAAQEELLPPDSGEPQAPAESVTWVARLIEFVQTNKEALLGLLGDATILVFALLIKMKSTKIKTDTGATNASQGAVVTAVNGMIDGYNAMKASYEQYGTTEADRNRVVGALVAQNTAVLEILMTAYGNSKNLPQGVKDLIFLKYANCMKSLSDDEQILAIVEAVKQNINSVGVERVEPEEALDAEPAPEV